VVLCSKSCCLFTLKPNVAFSMFSFTYILLSRDVFELRCPL
jgi:hypothetical protein